MIQPIAAPLTARRPKYCYYICLTKLIKVPVLREKEKGGSIYSCVTALYRFKLNYDSSVAP